MKETKIKDFMTEERREKMHDVQNGRKKREDTGSSGRKRAERRYRASRKEESREEIQGVQDGREQRGDTGSLGRSRMRGDTESSGWKRAERRYREFRTK